MSGCWHRTRTVHTVTFNSLCYLPGRTWRFDGKDWGISDHENSHHQPRRPCLPHSDALQYFAKFDKCRESRPRIIICGKVIIILGYGLLFDVDNEIRLMLTDQPSYRRYNLEYRHNREDRNIHRQSYDAITQISTTRYIFDGGDAPTQTPKASSSAAAGVLQYADMWTTLKYPGFRRMKNR